jgi:hypothetical protein
MQKTNSTTASPTLIPVTTTQATTTTNQPPQQLTKADSPRPLAHPSKILQLILNSFLFLFIRFINLTRYIIQHPDIMVDLLVELQRLVKVFGGVGGLKDLRFDDFGGDHGDVH